MSAQEHYISGVLETFSTFCEKQGVSLDIQKDATLALLELLHTLKTSNWTEKNTNHIFEKVQRSTQVSSQSIAILIEFVQKYPPLQTNIFLRKFLLALIADNCSKSTLKNYASDINQFFAFCQNSDLTKVITKPKLLSFLKHEAERGSLYATAKRKLVSLNQFGLWLIQIDFFSSSELAWLTDLNQKFSPHLYATDIPQIKETPKNEPLNASSFIAWSLPLPEYVAPKSDPNIEVGLPRIPHNSAQSQDYRFRFKKGLSELQRSINRKTNLWVISYFNIALVILFFIGLSYFGYQQFFKEIATPLAFPTSLTRPNRTLSFQGRLTDTAQNPITSATNFRFKLYDSGPSTSGGTQLWDSGTCSVTPDQDGIFSTGLGSDCGSEIDSSVFSENANVWLQVQVGAETLSPRQSIKSVAYALNAETLQGYPASASAVENTVIVMDNSGQIVLGNTNPVLKSTGTSFAIEGRTLTLRTASGSNGNIALTPDGLGQIIASRYISAPGATLSATYAGGTALVLRAGPSATADITQWQNSAGSALSIVNASGNFGIGTTSTRAALDVAGDASISGSLVFRNGTSSIDVLDGQSLDFKTSAGGDAGLTTKMSLSNSGNLGINTTNPVSRLTVRATTAFDQFSIISDYTAGGWARGADLKYTQSDTTVHRGLAYGLFGSGDTLTGAYFTAVSDAASPWSTAQLFLNANGNVGIGTNSPTNFNLQVTGDVGPSTNNTYNLGSSSFKWANVYATTFLQNGNAVCDISGNCGSSASYWQFVNGTLQPTAPYNTVSDIILGGTSTATAKFGFINVASGTPTATFSGNLAIATPTGSNPASTYNILNGGSINFRTSPGGDAGLTSRLFISNAGNIGINNSNPGTTLDVTGTASISSTLTLGGAIQPANGSLIFNYKSGTNSWTSGMFLNTAGNLGIGVANPSYKLETVGDISATNGNVYVSSTSAFMTANNVYTAQKEQNVSAATVGGAGWYCTAKIENQAGRGQNTVTLYTTGGSYTPYSTTMRWWHDWSTGAGISVISESGNSSYWDQAQVVDDGYASYLRVHFTQAVSVSMSMQYDGGYARGALYNGTLNDCSFTATRASAQINGFFSAGYNSSQSQPAFQVTNTGDASASGSLVLSKTSSPVTFDVLNGNRLDFQTSPGGDAGLGTKISLLSNGNFGIGTTGPGALFHVYSAPTTGTNLVSSIIQSSPSNGGGSTISRVSASANSSDFEQNNSSTSPFRYGTFIDTNIVNNYTAAAGLFGSINFVTNNAVGMTLTGGNAAGNLGIGVTAANIRAKLDVAGDASTSGSLVFRGTNPNTIDILNGTRLDFQTSPGGDAGLSSQMSLLSNGNLGIGTTNPSTFKLQVNGSIGPQTNNTYDLGSNALRWATVYGTTGNFTTVSATTINGTTINQNGNQVCDTTGNCAAIGNYWQFVSGTLQPANPYNTVSDILLGGAATASAKFAFINVASGTPTASFSGNLAIATPTGANAATTYNILNGGTYNLLTSPGGNAGLTSRLFVLNNGNIGINSTNPQAKLEVNGGNTQITQSGSSINDTSLMGLLVSNNNSSNSNHAFRVVTNSGSTEGLTVTNSGNNGIGTTTPTHKLEINGSAATAANGIGFGTSGTVDVELFRGAADRLDLASGDDFNLVSGNYSIGSNTVITSTRLIQAANGSNTTPSLSFLSDPNTGFYTDGSDKLTLVTNGTNRVSIDSSGNVGIGTTLPSNFLLQVNGSVGPQTNNTSDLGSASIKWANIYGVNIAGTSITQNGNVVCDVSGNCSNIGNFWQFVNGTLQPANPYNTVSDVILGGTSTASAKFGFINVNSGTPTATLSGNLIIATPTGANPASIYGIMNGGSINFQTSPGGNAGLTSRLFIANNGNIGIGNNTTPGATLDITGTASISSTLTMNGAIQPANGPLTFNYKNGANSYAAGITLTTTGNVGIGSTNPNQALDVNGDIKVTGNDIMDSGNTSRITLGSATTLTNTTLNLTGTTTLTASSLATFTTAASLSMGSTTTLTLGNDAVINGSSAANGNLTLQGTSNGTRTTSYVLLQPTAGNVGVGTTTAPAALLDVAGTASISSTLTLGGVVRPSTGDLTFQYKSGANSWANALTISNTGNIGIGTTGPMLAKFQLAGGDMILDSNNTIGSYYLRNSTNYDASRNNYNISLVGGLSGRLVNRNADFLDGTTGYSVYDNASSGKTTIATAADNTAPNTSGTVLRVSYDGTGTPNSAPTPGFGGFRISIPECTGTNNSVNDYCYKEGNRYLVKIWAKIPSGYNLKFATNGTGTGASQKFITSVAGTGDWMEYDMIQTIGIGGTLSSTGYWYVDNGSNSAFNWDVASLQYIGLDEAPSVQTATNLNIGYYQGQNLAYGELLTTQGSYLAVSGGNVGIGSTAPIAKLDVTGTASVSSILTMGGAIRPTTGDLTFQYKNGANSFTAGMVLNTAGNLGVGTTSPGSFKLQVSGSVGPTANNTYDLGSNALRWNNVYANAFSQNGNGVCDTSGNCSTIGNYWQFSNGTLQPTSPYNTISDIVLGGTSTATAKFGFINVNNGTPTASISGNITLRGSNPSQLNILNGNRFDILTSPGGDTGTPATTKFTIANNGNVGIGSTAPTQLFNIAGTSVNSAASQTNISAYVSNGLRINGTNNTSAQDAITYQSGSSGGAAAIAFGRGTSFDTFMSFYTNPSSNAVTGGISEVMRLNSSGSLGIGTTNPVQALEVNGDIKVTGNDITDSGNTSRITLGATTQLTNTTLTLSGTTTLTASSLSTFTSAAALAMSSTTTLTLGNDATINGSSSANGNLTLQGTSNGTRTTSYVLLQPTAGNVGINTTTPTAAFDVAGAASISSSLTYRTGAAFLTATQMNNLTLGTDASSNKITGNIILNPQLNVGIGTTLPTAKLNVTGNTNIDGNLQLRIAADSATSSRGILFTPAAFNGQQYIRGYGNSGGGLNIVGWNTGVGADTTSIFLDPGNGYMAFGTNSGVAATERMRIDSAGNIGINTTNPSSFKLQVNGNVGPQTNNTFDLGSSSLKWANVYATAFLQNGNTVCDSSNNCPGFTNYWQYLNGAISLASPYTNSSDLLIGGSSTASAKFAFVNVLSGTPTASISGNLAIGSPTGLTAANTFDILNGGSLTFRTSVGGQATTTNAMLISNQGNVGIGTTTPFSVLDVSGSGGVNATNVKDLFRIENSDANTANNAANMTFLNKRAGDIQTPVASISGIITNVGATTYTGALAFSTAGTAAIPTERVRIDSNGNFGIGTTNPTRLLTVNGSTGALISTSTASAPASGGQALIVHAATSTATAGVFTVHSNVGSSGAEKFRIQADGNVGIGTTTPIALIDISGTASVSSTLTMGGAIQPATDVLNFNYKSGTNSYATGMTLNTLGNLGIGTTNPIVKLEVSGQASISSTLTLGGNIQPSSGPLNLMYKNSSNGYTIGMTLSNTAGNLGVGQSNPLAKLDVGGTASVSSSLTIGSILQPNTGPLTFNYKSGGNSWATAMTITTAGNVGIGTTLPSSYGGGGLVDMALSSATTNTAVTVLNVTRTSSGTAANGIGGRLEFNLQNSAGTITEASTINSIFTQAGAGSVSSAITFNTRDNNGSFTEGMRIDSLGRVAIATTSATTNLTVYNGNESTTLTNFTQSLSNAGIQIMTDFTDLAYTPGVFWGTTNNNSNKPNGGIFLNETNASGTTMYLGTSNSYASGITSYAVINPNGNLGLGTTQPVYKFEVADRMRIKSGAQGSAGSWLADSSGNNRGFIGLYDDTASPIVGLYNSVSGWGLTLNSSGNVSIGTTSYPAPLYVYSSVNSSWVGSVTASSGGIADGIIGGQVNGTYWTGMAGKSNQSNGVGVYGEASAAGGFGGYFRNTSTGPALITGGGNVGIGTTNPAGILDIYGNSTLYFGDTSTRSFEMRVASGDFYVGSNTQAGNVVVRNTSGTAIVNLDTTLSTFVEDIRVGTSGTNGCVQRFDGNSVAGVCSSDQRLKTNIHPLGSVLDRITKITPSTYEWNQLASDLYDYKQGSTGIGFIAQEVEQYMPELVSYDQNGYRKMNYTAVPIYSVMAIKELNTKFNAVVLDSEGQVALTGDNGTYTVTQVNTGTPLTKIVAAAQVISAKITAGLITTKELVVQNTAQIASLSVDQMTIAGQSLHDYIASIVQEQTSGTASGSGTLVSPVANMDVNSITAQTATITGTLAAQTTNTLNLQANTATVAGNFSAGNTQLSSLLTQDATVTGTIAADNITVEHSARIAQLEANQAQLDAVRATTADLVNATISGTLYADNIYNFEDKIASTLQKPGFIDALTGNKPDVPAANPVSVYDPAQAAGYEPVNPSFFTAADGQNLAANDIILNASAAYINKYLQVNGVAYVTKSLGVGESIFVGNSTLISDGVIAYIPANDPHPTLAIQPTGLGSIDLLAGLVHIENGQVAVNGDLHVAGTTTTKTLLTNLMQPADFGNPFQVQVAGLSTQSGQITKSRFEIVNEVGTPVATISAEGKADFAGGISIGSQNLEAPAVASGSSATVTANQTSGKAKIPAGTKEITIQSDQISDKTLIYVTPTGSTQNQVLYVKSQTAEDPNTAAKEGKFVVGFDQSIGSDVNFNWWIVN